MSEIKTQLVVLGAGPAAIQQPSAQLIWGLKQFWLTPEKPLVVYA